MVIIDSSLSSILQDAVVQIACALGVFAGATATAVYVTDQKDLRTLIEILVFQPGDEPFREEGLRIVNGIIRSSEATAVSFYLKS